MESLDKSIEIGLCVPVLITMLDKAKISVISESSYISVIDVQHFHQRLMVINPIGF